MNSESPTPQLDTHEFSFEGRDYRLYKRRPGKDEHWYFRIQRNGQRRPRSMETNVAENAITKAKAAIKAAKGETWDEFLDKTALRKTCIITLAQICTLYLAYPNRNPAAKTRNNNILALLKIIHSLPQHKNAKAEELPLSALDGDLIYAWKQSVLKSADSADVDASRHRQILRSANSCLIQARSVFTADLKSFYRRTGKLTLPKQIDSFLEEPKFPADETGKTDYWPPNDQTIAKTFQALESLVPGAPHPDRQGPTLPEHAPAIQGQNLNMYKAIWLALGFGLRKSEAAVAKVSWLQDIGGILYCAGDELAKNHKFPRVRAQLGAWARLQHLLAGMDPDAYILTGTKHERTDDVFRRISDWMHGLGWSTQKTFHEFRSWAGCQIAMGDGSKGLDLRAAQEFLRHANITTTENYYMRYLRSQLKEVTLKLPTPQPFIPKIITA